MTELPVHIPRSFTYLVETEKHSVYEAEIEGLNANLVILGEPGIGKSESLKEIQRVHGWSKCTAKQLVYHPNPASFLAEKNRLLIDGMDELTVGGEGDAIFKVLGKLTEAGNPDFILACRAADWRGAAARPNIEQMYGSRLLELTLTPFSRKDAIAFLESRTGRLDADRLVQALESKGLEGFFGNPLTLSLIFEVFQEKGSLPETRSELFEQATIQMSRETNPGHTGSKLAALDRDTAMNAAGALCATFILSGKEDIVRDSAVGTDTDILLASELQTLPGGGDVTAILGSRLFYPASGEADRLRPVHRTVAEYLGARWLAQSAKNDLMRRRILGMMAFAGGIPSSLRGIHAWLAFHSSEMAKSVIHTDPYGVLRYGEADRLTVTQAKLLLRSLVNLQAEDPFFRAEDWESRRISGLTKKELKNDIREIILDSRTNIHLRSILLEALRGSELAGEIQTDLEEVGLNLSGQFFYAERISAIEAILDAPNSTLDVQAFIERLIECGDDDSTRLALETIEAASFENISSNLMARSVLAHLRLLDDKEESESNLSGVLFLLSRKVPLTLIGSLLNALAAIEICESPRRPKSRSKRRLHDFIMRLIQRYLESESPDATTLLKWLQIPPKYSGHLSEAAKPVSDYLKDHKKLRRALQEKVLFSETEELAFRDRCFRLSDINEALSLTDADIVELLEDIATRRPLSSEDDENWRALVEISCRRARSQEILTAARLAVGSDEKRLALIQELSQPIEPPEWEVQSRLRQEASEKEKNATLRQTRRQYAERISEIRSGDWRWLTRPAWAYLGYFPDRNHESDPGNRIGAWLGEDLKAASLEGFEAALEQKDLVDPSEVASAHADGKPYNYMFPVIAGVTQRVLAGDVINDLDLDILIAARISLDHVYLEDSETKRLIIQSIDSELRDKPHIWERVLRLRVEPFLEQKSPTVPALYELPDDGEYRETMFELAIEWLQNFDAISLSSESILIDIILSRPPDALTYQLYLEKIQSPLREQERSDIWDSVGIIIDFENTKRRLGDIPDERKTLIWSLRDRLDSTRQEKRNNHILSAEQRGWIIRTFRGLWPLAEYPNGEIIGPRNAGDASAFIRSQITLLGNDTSRSAALQIAELVNDVEDNYTPFIKHAAATQSRQSREEQFGSITVEQIKDVLLDRPPRMIDDLRAIVEFALDQVQARLKGSETDPVNKYWEGDKHRPEDWCTDRVIEDLELHLKQYSVSIISQRDMPNGKRADFVCSFGGNELPVEAKGEWNRELWTAASVQLGGLYSRAASAQGSGVYLVYWFGGSRLRALPNGAKRPRTAEQLQQLLVDNLSPEWKERITIYVLDLCR